MEEKKKRPLTEKQKAAFERRRMEGYRRYLKELRKEIRKRKRAEKKKKEKERLKKQKLRLKEKERKKNKRPVGRPKKRGPKKKYYKKVIKEPKKKGAKKKLPFSYKIISCRNGKQNKFIGKYRTIEEAYEVFDGLRDSDKNVIFPSIINNVGEISNTIDEYILIEKSDSENTLLRNEYGKLVEQTINQEGWIVIDKIRYLKEERFWVYGYDSKFDRKDFLWVYENLIINNIDIYSFKRICLYKNKLIIRDDNNHIDMVICKDIQDSIRLYNKIEEWIKNDKIKQVIFIGNFSEISPKRKKLEEELINLTGWTRKKIQMKHTTFYNK